MPIQRPDIVDLLITLGIVAAFAVFAFALGGF